MRPLPRRSIAREASLPTVPEEERLCLSSLLLAVVVSLASSEANRSGISRSAKRAQDCGAASVMIGRRRCDAVAAAD